MNNSPTLPAGTHIGAVTFRTADLPKLTDFYTQIFGLKVLSSTESKSSLGVQTDGKPVELLVLIEDKSAVQVGHSHRALFHAAFIVPSRAQLGQFLSHLKKSGWKLDGASDHLVSEALYLTDPDGNGLEVYRDLPRESWKFAPNGELVMALDPVDLEELMREGDQLTTPWTGMPSGTIVGHMHLQVSDISKANSFYQGIVGLDQTSGLIPSASFLSAGGYHHHLAVNTWHITGFPGPRPALLDALAATNTTTDAPHPSVTKVGLVNWELVIPDSDAHASLVARLKAAETFESENNAIYGVDPDGIKMAVRI
jgi:catechol 2,3-dioxygenase